MRTLNPVPDLLRVFEAFCVARDVGDQRGSTLAFGAGHRITDLKAGGDIGIHAIERALQRMSDEWPPHFDNQWPKDIPRPPRTRVPRKRRPETALAR